MNSIEKKTISIKTWAEEDRPREKMALKGRTALSDAELIAILIGSGNKEMSAVELSRHLLSIVNNDLNELSKLALHDLLKIKGIGEAKALTIMSALELGRRRKGVKPKKKESLKYSDQIYEFMKPCLLDLKHEEFWIILLNRSQQVIQKVMISSGGISGTVVDSKLIFKIALENLASGILLVHNHPSGNTNPSNQDVKITQQLVQTGLILEIPILDHIIFTDTGYYSFADENRLR